MTAAALKSGRRLAESRMVDVCEVARPTGDPDPLSGFPSLLPVWGGRCRVQTYEPQESRPEVGGASVTVQRYSVHVPVGVYRPEVGDVVTVTESQHDPHLTGRVFRVSGLLHKTAATAYRLMVEEVG